MLEISESLHRATNKLIGTHLVSFVIRLDLGRGQLLVNLGLRGEQDGPLTHWNVIAIKINDFLGRKVNVYNQIVIVELIDFKKAFCLRYLSPPPPPLSGQ